MKLHFQDQKGIAPIVIVIILSILAVGVGGGIWYFKQSEKNKQEKENQKQAEEFQKKIQEKEKSEENIKEETGRKTYTNKELGLSFSHSKDWFLTQDEEGIIVTNFKYPQEDGRELNENETKIVINIEDNPEKMTPKAWSSKLIGEETTIIKKEEITVDGKNAYKVKAQDEGIYTAVYFAKSSTQMVEIMNYGNDKELTNILNSFRLI